MLCRHALELFVMLTSSCPIVVLKELSKALSQGYLVTCQKCLLQQIQVLVEELTTESEEEGM